MTVEYVDTVCISCDFASDINPDVRRQIVDSDGFGASEGRHEEVTPVDTAVSAGHIVTGKQLTGTKAELREYLKERPCDRLITGKCPAAVFLINKALAAGA